MNGKSEEDLKPISNTPETLQENSLHAINLTRIKE